MTEVTESTKNLGEVFEKQDPGFLIQQEIVSVEIDSDYSKDENDVIEQNIRALPNSSDYSQ